MTLSSTTFGRMAIALLTMVAVITVASANERGAIQATAQASFGAVSSGFPTEVSASEDGQFHGSRISPADREGRHLYIVRFHEPSLARYEGGIEGINPTSTRVTGQRIDVRSTDARAYLEFLGSRHDKYLSRMGQNTRRTLTPTHQYLNVLNGVAVRLSAEEADLVAGLPFVKGIEIDRLDELLTDEGPTLVGAPDFWAGEITGGVGNKGEGIIIGIIDSGFNHGHPSFAAVAEDGYEHINPYGDGVFTGVCADPDAGDYEDLCNNKLIGAYSIAAASTTAEDTAASGHGTHVGSTAGGNPLSGLEIPFNYQTLEVDIVGVAPRANLINYKVCEPLCSAVSRIAAIDFAIDDGVHVLNHSIGNGEPPWASAVSLAFLDANAAGIFVAASAGNSGPGPATATSTGPWNTAVAASTHQRRLGLELDIDGGPSGIPVFTTSGPALTGPLSGNLAYAGDVDQDNFLACEPFPANSFDGVGALVRRGDCAFVDKVNNAADAGATFVIIANNAPGAFGAGGLEGTPVVSIGVTQSTGDLLIDEINGGSVGVTIESIIDVDPANADIIGGFSSRGPASYNFIAPAVTAPGVQILAASTTANDNFNIIGGTSMSSPHVAGAAALLMALHPDWTPTEVRSALTLTANPNTLKEDGMTPGDAFDHGSGRIQVADAGSIGFVMDESIANFIAANPAEGGEPADLNMSSIQNRTCITECSYQRTIRSVVNTPVDYTVTSDVPAGVTITVTPSNFTLNPGEELTLDIDINVSGAPFEEWLFADIRIEQAAVITGRSAVIDEDFEGSFPPNGWTVNNLGGDCVWARNDQLLDQDGEPTPGRDNFAGGQGFSAAADADLCDGGSTMDTELLTPMFDPTADFELSFDMSFRMLGASRFDVEVTTDGSTWDLIESFSTSVDPTGPGVRQTYDLSAYAGETDVQVRFRYVAPGWHWYAQVDNVTIGEPPEPVLVSDAHIPVAVISQEPQPTIALSVESLMATQQRDEVTSQEFSISNIGQLPLEWSLNELGPQGGPRNVVSGVIWDNPQAGTSGRVNNFSTPADTGIYQSDAFAILASSTIETIFSAGFILGSPGVTELSWMIFEDADGVPAGDPETNPESAIWSFTAAVDAAGVSFDDADMSLDLAAAGAPPLALEPGTYWLLAYPTVQNFSLGPNNLYAWFHGESAATGRQIGPDGLAGFPTSWAGVPEGRAFTLTGTIDCSSQFNPWTNVNPTSGMLDPGESDEVTVEFFSTGLLEGTYNSAFCILSNDPDQPGTLMPVQLNVINLPEASISPDSLEFSVELGASDTDQVVITNTGLGELEYSVRGAGNRLRGSSTLIYDQTASQTTQGTLAIYDLDEEPVWVVQAADDFTVPPGEAWTVDRVIANGFYVGLGNPATSVRVFFYEDDNGQPGDELVSFMDLAPSNDDAGVLTFDLPQTVDLGSGTYWLSVQPEMDFFADGRWFWFQNSEQAGNEAHWRNPEDSYGTGCTDWDTFSNCGFVNPDSSFQLFGEASDACVPVNSIPWLSVDPESGTVAAEGGSQAIDLVVDGGAVQPGSYQATICFDTNDGGNPILPVDINLLITGESPDQIYSDRFELQD